MSLSRLSWISTSICIALFSCACGGGGQSPVPSKTVKFAPVLNLSTNGSGSGSVALGDFNGDGKTDIAVSNFQSNSISVFLNQGNGTFSSPIVTNLQIANSLGSIIAGDFNEDGKTDLIAATVSGPQVNLVLISNGDGTFTQKGSIPGSFGFFSARVADLNGDKHLDLIAGGNGNMSVALGNGDGTFQSTTWLGNGPMPNTFFGVDVGDVNGDGKLDIVGLNYGYSTGNVDFFRGNGDGTFQPPSSISTTLTGPSAIALADFNGDGKLDALIGYSPGSVSVSAGKGDGTFDLSSATVLYASGGGSGATVRAVDVNGDGQPDALMTDYASGIFTLVINKGHNIASGTTYSYTFAAGLCDVAAADVNGDGILDIVLVNKNTNQISILLSQ
ncbi:MAG TPA: VCBS repeat-containing protein [candidate division Zixibacteria bacterium]|nr:VCBS repeat-containing protein [candidate division Zixibacteria bacterium]